MRSTDPRCVLTVALAAALCVASGAPASAQPRPNVLFVCIDALRADRLGTYGAEPSPSPSLDALARQSVVFEHAVSVASWTKPAVPSLLTGLYPTEHGVIDASADRVDVLAPSVPTLAERLRAAGYETAAFVHNDHLLRRYSGLDRGFGTYFENAGSPPEIADRFLSWRETRTQGRPWFAYLHFLDPHYPYTPDRFLLPAAEAAALRVRDIHWALRSSMWPMLRRRIAAGLLTLTAQDRDALDALYRGEIRAVDAVIGRMLQLLDAAGVLDETMIVVTADHGEGFGERGRIDHGYGLYRELVHVPLIVRFPARRGAGMRVPWLVQSLDAAPTALDLLDLEPAPASSVSLLPVLDDPARPLRRHAYSEERHGRFESIAMRDDRFTYVRSHGPLGEPPPPALAVPRDLAGGIRIRADGIFDGTRVVADAIRKIEAGDPDLEIQGPVAELDEAAATIGVLGMRVRIGDGVHGGDDDAVVTIRDLSLAQMVRAHGSVVEGVFVPTKLERVDETLVEIEGNVTGFRVEQGGDVHVALEGISLLVDAAAQWKHFASETVPAAVPPGGGPIGAAEEELFDRQTDPAELRNVSATHPDVLARLREAADAFGADLAARSPGTANEAPLDEQTRERLRALGYVE